jgi:hypothetical protein
MADAPHDESGAPGDDFIAWARLSAQMFRRNVAERARIVHDAGVDQEWRDLDARWFDALADDLAQGKLERLERYLSLCKATRREREAAGEQIPSLIDEKLRHVSSRPPPPRRSALADRASGDSVTPPFARPLSPPGTRPAPPRPGQSTTAVFKQDLRDAIATGEAAAEWPVERYAWLCAELEIAPERRAAIWTAHELGGELAADAVHGIWDIKLAADADLRRKHGELVGRYAAAIRRGDRSQRPR